MKKGMWNKNNDIVMTAKFIASDGTEARAYIRAKNLSKKLCACAGCGREIPWNGTTCVSFGVHMCLKCRIKNS